MTMTKNKMKTVRVIGNDDDGYYAKLGKRMLKPVRGFAAEAGTWIDKDSCRRNVRKQLTKRGIEVGSFGYKYEIA